jgi:polar amino acid transport system substrate-binding protein
MKPAITRIRTAACAAALTLLTALPAAAADLKLPAAVKAKGQITIGINAIFPPMEFKNPGSEELTGFDVDFANAIGQALGVKVVFDDQKFDQLINSVNTGRADFVISGLSDTAKRRETLDFIDYFNSGTQGYTTKALSATINGLEALSGKTLAVSAATDYLTTMQQWSKDNLESKGKPGITMLAVDSEATARLQMVQGRAQASAISPEVFGWLEKQSPGQFVAIGPILAPDPYGICFKKTNTELRDAVFAAVKQLFENGTYQKLLAKWELSRDAIPTPLINGKKP